MALRELVQQQLGGVVRVDENRHQEEVGLGFEESPVGESQSNGVSENTVQQIQGHVRTIRDGLEERYQQKVAGTHPSMPWLVCHAAGVLNKLQVGEDGETSYERECVLWSTVGT